MRTKIRFLAIVGAMLLGITASGAALAQHGGHGGHRGYGRGGYGHYGFGVYVGVPLFSPWYYPPAYSYPPYPYYPPAAVSSPSVYIEQSGRYQSAPVPQTPQYRYYCNASRAYYPYVNACPGGWQRVAPRPPPPPR